MLSRWFTYDTSYSGLEEARHRLEQLFEDLDPYYEGYVTPSTWPRATLYDTGSSYVLTCEVPGLEASSYQLQAVQQSLTISGERKTAVPEGYSVHRQERTGIRFSRTFTFPSKVDLERVTATAKNGILTINLPKAPEIMPREISVQVR
jgi:HSP20 family protein